MRSRPLLLLIALAFVAASCGVSRDAAANDVAATIEFVDGSSSEVFVRDLNEIVVPTRDNEEFVAAAYQGVVPAGFDAIVLSQTIAGEVLQNELTKLGAETSTADLDEATTRLLQQLEGLLPTSTDPAADAQRLYDEVPYLPFIAGLQARQIALSAALADTAGGAEGDPCVRHILLEQEAEADDVFAELEAGGDFAALAAERSIGPTGPAGGDLGCAPATAYVAEFAAAVTEAEVGVYVGPVQTQFGWHVIVVDRFEVNGDQLAQQALTESLTSSTITVDETLGTWDVNQGAVVPVQP